MSNLKFLNTTSNFSVLSSFFICNKIPQTPRKMMKQKMSKSSTTFTIFMLIISLTSPVLTSSVQKPCSPPESKTEFEIHKQSARDAITLSIREIRETIKFISSIPGLKSSGLNEPDPELMLCIEHMISDLSEIKFALYRLKHLKKNFLESDTNKVKKMMGRSSRMGKICCKTFKNVDEIVLSLLTRKLDDLSMVVDYVVYRVSEIERGEFRGETGEKP